MKTNSKVLFAGGFLILCVALVWNFSGVFSSSPESQSKQSNLRYIKDESPGGLTSASTNYPNKKRARTSTSQSRNLTDFNSEYLLILKNLRGKEARLASYKLMEEAKVMLNLVDFQEFCTGFKSLELWQHGIDLIAERYAAENYNEGLQWLDTLPNDTSSLPAFVSFAKSAGFENYKATLSYALDRTDKNEAGALLAGLLSAGNEATSLEIIALVNHQSGLMKGVLFPLSTAVLPFLGSGDYQTAIKVSEAIAQPSERHDSLRNLMISATQEDPVAASDLLNSIKSEKDKLVMIDPLISSWLASDPNAASSWAAAQESSLLRDRAFSSISRCLLAVNQDEALSWAMGISDAGLRGSQIEKVIRFVKSNGTQADFTRLESQLKTK